MPNKRTKRSNDLVFIFLDEATLLSVGMNLPLTRMSVFSAPGVHRGNDIILTEFVRDLNMLAGKYLCRPNESDELPANFPITGTDAFGIVHYAIEKALVSSHNLKATQEMLPLIEDLESLLKSRWRYADHRSSSPERIAYYYRYSTVMSAQRVQGKRVDLDLEPRQEAKIIKTSERLLATYSYLVPELCSLLAERHAMHLGHSFGEKLSKNSASSLTP
jgi:hypothetical protein